MKKKKVNKLIKKYEEKKKFLDSELDNISLSQESKHIALGEYWMCKKILRDLKELKK